VSPSPRAALYSYLQVIVLAFTVGCLINRRRDTQITYNESLDDVEGQRYVDSPPLKPTLLQQPERPVRKAPNIFFVLLSRFFNAFPFLIEIWYWNLTYWYVHYGVMLIDIC
jgi:hypothetical protein